MIIDPFALNPTNKELVDRMLGIAYERVKKVVENLDAIQYVVDNYSNIAEAQNVINNLTESIQSLKTTTIPHFTDLGNVEDETQESSEITADSFLVQFINIAPYIKSVSDNIDYIKKAGIYLNDILALSAITGDLKNVSQNISEIKNVSSSTQVISSVASYMKQLLVVTGNIKNILLVANNYKNIDIVADNVSHIKNLSDKIHSLISLDNNLDNIKKAVSYYDTFKQILSRKDLIDSINKYLPALELINNNLIDFNKLVVNQNIFTELFNYIDKFTLLALHADDLHKTADNIELIKNYSDLSDKITALYSALYPMAERSEVTVPEFTSLQFLIDTVASGTTIILSQNLRENIVIPSGKRIYLDLSGYTITSSSNTDTIRVELGGFLHIKGNGTIDNTFKGMAPLLNNGTCIVESGTFTKSESEYYAILNHGQMTLGVGVVAFLKPDATSSVVVNGYYDYGSKNERLGHVPNVNLAYPILTITGGSYSGGLNTIKNDDAGTMVINNGEFNHSFNIYKDSNGAALFNVHKLTVNYANVNAKNAIAVYNRYYNNSVDLGIVNINNGIYFGAIVNHNTNGKINRNGGVFKEGN